MQRRVTCLWKEPGAAQPFRAGVSLHGHTNHSREGVSFILEFAARHNLLRRALATQEKKSISESAVYIDFDKGYWTPPLPPLAAFELEKSQIENVLGVQGMVSITDHDNIEAPMLLRMVPEARSVPISVEWTVPFYDAIFHLGVHNLPINQAESIMAHLAAYTLSPTESRLAELLEFLHGIPEVLIILNHPLWNLAGLSSQHHESKLRGLLCKYGQFIHALELSGIRSWEENQSVLHLSEACNQLVISGGDRHGCEPNAALNLTNAQTFSEFVHEVRRERKSEVLFMPQYTEPFALRVLQTLLDVVRDYPEYSAGSRRWDDRVFHPNHAGVVSPLSDLWIRPPFYIRYFFSLVGLLQVSPVKSAMKLALTRPSKAQTFVLSGRQEVAQ